jgi:hypothetical protein
MEKPKYQICVPGNFLAPILGLDHHGYQRLIALYGEMILLISMLRPRLPSYLVGVIFSYFCKDYGKEIRISMPIHYRIWYGSPHIQYSGGFKLVVTDINNVGYRPIPTRKPCVPGTKYASSHYNQCRRIHLAISKLQNDIEHIKPILLSGILKSSDNCSKFTSLSDIRQIRKDLKQYGYALQNILALESKLLEQRRAMVRTNQLKVSTESDHYKLCAHHHSHVIFDKLQKQSAIVNSRKVDHKDLCLKFVTGTARLISVAQECKRYVRGQTQKEKRKATKDRKRQEIRDKEDEQRIIDIACPFKVGENLVKIGVVPQKRRFRARAQTQKEKRLEAKSS